MNCIVVVWHFMSVSNSNWICVRKAADAYFMWHRRLALHCCELGCRSSGCTCKLCTRVYIIFIVRYLLAVCDGNAKFASATIVIRFCDICFAVFVMWTVGIVFALANGIYRGNGSCRIWQTVIPRIIIVPNILQAAYLLDCLAEA